MQETTSVAICVATYLRPKLLGECIDSLRALRINGLDVHLIIADNDAAGSAEAVVRERTRDFPFPVTYLTEPTRGLASIRNRLVAEAVSLNVEFIASVDDDATAQTDWLQKLVATAIAYDADTVAGPAIYVFDEDVPKHIRMCFQSAKSIDGQHTMGVGTGNALFRTTSLTSIPGPFDWRFNLSGGEDRALEAALLTHRAKIVSCPEAKVYEYLPSSRANIRWILQRRFSDGVILSRVVRLISPSRSKTLKHFAISLLRTVVRGVQFIASIAIRRDYALHYLSHMLLGAGSLMTLFSSRHTPDQYKTIHGE